MTAPIQQAISWSLNVPNAITSLRVVLAIFAACLLTIGAATATVVAGILLSIAAITDWLDGFTARKLGKSTEFGAIYDLAADRVLMTPPLVIAVHAGIFAPVSNLMPFNPYPYAVVVVAADLTVLAGIASFLRKRRTQPIPFPSPTPVAKLAFPFQIAVLVLAILAIAPPLLLASLMYLGIIFTILAFVSYMRRGGYVFSS